MKTILQSLAIAPFLAFGVAADAQTLAQCGRYPDDKPNYICTCSSGQTSGSVWGSGPYTGDSDLCQAARHAGVIGPDGGEIMAEAVVGDTAYTGSLQNGVTTSDWGAYPLSVQFIEAQADLAECTAFSAAASPLTCLCAANPARSGSVWGNSPFTADSDICTAAQFEGVLGTEAGVVRLIATQGLDDYAEASRNGITTRSWGAYGESYVFDWNLR